MLLYIHHESYLSSVLNHFYIYLLDIGTDPDEEREKTEANFTICLGN